MNDNNIFNNLVPGDILTTNRLPTDEEREKIQQSVAPLEGKLRDLETEISSVRSQIEEAKAHIVQMDAKLKQLYNEKKDVMKACEPYRLALSPFRSLTEDVLREICVACLPGDDEDYPIATKASSAPIKLTRISSVIRTVALTTPTLWASVQFNYDYDAIDYRKSLSVLKRCASAATEWFPRTGALPLNVALKERTIVDKMFNSRIISGDFFDTFISYSSRWREVRFRFTSSSTEPLYRISALKATDVPLLRKFGLEYRGENSPICSGTILSAPTLRHLYLCTWNKDISIFSAGWENFTVLQIHGEPVEEHNAVTSIATILRQTTRLEYLGIDMGNVTEEGDTSEVFLPCLKALDIGEVVWLGPNIHGLLGFINAPALVNLQLRGAFLDSSICHLFQCSPALRYLELKLYHRSFAQLKDVLYHCPSLRHLSILAPNEYRLGVKDSNADELLKAFVSSGDQGYLCPRMHTFKLNGETPVSADRIREFLVARREGHGVMGLSNWAKVVLTAYKGSRTWQQTWAVVKEQQDAGLNVSLVEPTDHNGSI